MGGLVRSTRTRVMGLSFRCGVDDRIVAPAVEHCSQTFNQLGLCCVWLPVLYSRGRYLTSVPAMAERYRAWFFGRLISVDSIFHPTTQPLSLCTIYGSGAFIRWWFRPLDREGDHVSALSGRVLIKRLDVAMTYVVTHLGRSQCEAGTLVD